MNISFIGGGVMAEAIIGGVLGQGIATAADICVGEPVESRRAALSDRYGVSTMASNGEAAEHGRLVVLSVKPQQLDRGAARAARKDIGEAGGGLHHRRGTYEEHRRRAEARSRHPGHAEHTSADRRGDERVDGRTPREQRA